MFPGFTHTQIARMPADKLRERTASFKWQVSPLLLYSLPWHRARTEPSRKVSCQSAYCRATLFGGSREKRFASRSRSVDGTEYVTSFVSRRKKKREFPRRSVKHNTDRITNHGQDSE